jgi:hypothetical protein
MSAPTMTHNGRPVPAEMLLSQVQALAVELGELPSQNRIRTQLHVGSDRARQLRRALIDLHGESAGPARTQPAPVPESTVDTPADVESPQVDPVPAPVPVTETTPAPATNTPGSQQAGRDSHAGRSPGRLLAWTALLVALGASVAANVAYARHGMGPRLSAGTAPLLVVLAAGLLERVPLAGARWWQRWLAVGGLVFVVLAAFITSYQHQSALLLAYGNPPLSSVLLPFAVDALIVMSSVCLAVIAERRRDQAGR